MLSISRLVIRGIILVYTKSARLFPPQCMLSLGALNEDLMTVVK